MQTNDVLIKIEDLKYAYDAEEGQEKVFALNGIDLDIHKGEFVAIVGRNGSGKSTLALNMNALLLPAEGKVDIQISSQKIVGQICLDDIVLDPVRRPVQEIDVPENAGETEFILIFQITSVTPLQDQDSQQVVSFLNELCYIELRRVVGNLAVPNIGPVQPDIETRIHSLEIQECARGF